jgi:hypothetical protein
MQVQCARYWKLEYELSHWLVYAVSHFLCHAMPCHYRYVSRHIISLLFILYTHAILIKYQEKQKTEKILRFGTDPNPVLLSGYHRTNMKMPLYQSQSRSLIPHAPKKSNTPTPSESDINILLTQAYPDSPSTHTPTSPSRNTRSETAVQTVPPG